MSETAEPVTIDELRARLGQELGVSPWLTVGQDMIDAFADVTLDRQFIHIDPARAKATSFGTTIAHGFLTLSLLSHLAQQVLPKIANVAMSLNYGFDRVRFIAPVRSRSEIRGRFSFAAIDLQAENRYQMKIAATVEIKDEAKPALSADWLTMVLLAA